jgi:Malectin domain
MILLILLLTVATRVIAYEQIYAINAGGEHDHTDSDGIHYEKRTISKTHKWHRGIGGNIPKSDEPIYQYVDFGAKIKYDLPMKSDGLYVLITKFSYANSYSANLDIMNMSLNHDLRLLSNVDQFLQCGGFGKICDKYFYFCVSDQILYYKDQSSLIQNEKISIDFNGGNKNSFIAGLVLLKGSLGEKRKLNSSATREEMYFDPLKTHPRCLPPLTVTDLQNNMEVMFENYWKNYTTICEVNKFSWENVLVANEKTQEAVENHQKQQKETLEKHQDLFSNLSSTIQSSFGSTQAAIHREIQSVHKQQSDNSNRIEKVVTQINRTVSTIFIVSSLRQIS